jgi:hypothetical protein
MWGYGPDGRPVALSVLENEERQYRAEYLAADESRANAETRVGPKPLGEPSLEEWERRSKAASDRLKSHQALMAGVRSGPMYPMHMLDPKYRVSRDSPDADRAMLLAPSGPKSIPALKANVARTGAGLRAARGAEAELRTLPPSERLRSLKTRGVEGAPDSDVLSERRFYETAVDEYNRAMAEASDYPLVLGNRPPEPPAPEPVPAPAPAPVQLPPPAPAPAPAPRGGAPLIQDGPPGSGTVLHPGARGSRNPLASTDVRYDPKNPYVPVDRVWNPPPSELPAPAPDARRDLTRTEEETGMLAAQVAAEDVRRASGDPDRLSEPAYAALSRKLDDARYRGGYLRSYVAAGGGEFRTASARPAPARAPAGRQGDVSALIAMTRARLQKSLGVPV